MCRFYLLKCLIINLIIRHFNFKQYCLEMSRTLTAVLNLINFNSEFPVFLERHKRIERLYNPFVKIKRSSNPIEFEHSK